MLVQRDSLEMMVFELLRTPRYSIATYDVKFGSSMMLGEIRGGERLQQVLPYVASYRGVALHLEQSFQHGIGAFLQWGVEDYLQELFSQDERYRPLLLRAKEKNIEVFAVEYPERELQVVAERAEEMQAFVEKRMRTPGSYPEIAAEVFGEMKNFPELLAIRRIRQIPERFRSSLIVECPAIIVPWVLSGLSIERDAEGF